MDCSQCPVHPQLKGIFHEYAKKDADIARSHGARPTGRSPVGNKYLGELDADTAHFLQAVAWDTVREYQARNA